MADDNHKSGGIAVSTISIQWEYSKHSNFITMINITINNDIAVEWESVSFFAWLTWEKDHVTIQGELYQLPVRKRQNI